MKSRDSFLKKIGLFGGSFDPPHLAHRSIAEHAVNQLELDMLHVLPTGTAWHKNTKPSLSSYRLEMTKLNFSDLPRTFIDDREIKREGPSFTIDTLNELSKQYMNASFFLIIGQDQAQSLENWKNLDDILRLAIIVVAARGDTFGKLTSWTPPLAIQSRFKQLDIPVMGVSATQIRMKIAGNQDVGSLVYEPVARYIEQYKIYQKNQ